MSASLSAAGNAAPLAASSTDTAAASGFGIERAINGQAAAMEIEKKYNDERNKRIRSDGNSQFVDLSALSKFKQYQQDPWIDPSVPEVGIPALKDGSHYKYLIIGAGFGGLLFAVRLIQQGINPDEIRIVDSAGGFGGTWYWNRYPGLMCDVESYIYMPLLEEMDYVPKHRYAYGPELRGYAESIADKWNLRDKTFFRAELKAMTWDEDQKEWTVGMVKNGSNLTVQCEFVFLTAGLLNVPKLPGLPGMADFQGHSFHTSRWDYNYTGGSPSDPSLNNLKDKRVGIIGTGATAIQVIPELAKWAKELHVFQRTPSSVDIRDQRLTDISEWKNQVGIKKGWQRERMENFNAHISHSSPHPSINMINDQWSFLPTYHALVGGPNKLTPEEIPNFISSLHALDIPRQNRIRSRVDEFVKDSSTAEKLKAWYPTWCKRPCFHDDYLPSFNLPSVTLVDTDGKGVDSITEHGVVVGDKEYKLDVLIFSTGFQSPAIGGPAARAGITITGRNKMSLEDKWAQGVGTLHGVISHNFPNLFLPGPYQVGVAANQMYVLDQLSTHVAYMVAEASKGHKRTIIEPSKEAEENWTMRIVSGAAAFAGIAGCTPSYLNKEGEIDRVSSREDQMKAARGSVWGQGASDYAKTIEEWRNEGGLKGLEVTTVT